MRKPHQWPEGNLLALSLSRGGNQQFRLTPLKLGRSELDLIGASVFIVKWTRLAREAQTQATIV